MSEQRRSAIKDRGVTRMSDDNFHMVDNRPLPPDVLKGIREITLFMEGTDDKSAIRGMYHRTETSNTIPTFKHGSMTCARRSTIRATIWSQESRTWESALQEDLVRLYILLNGILAALPEQTDDKQIVPVMAETTRTIQRLLKTGGA